MPSEPIITELQLLISDAREQLTYFHELGIENLEQAPGLSESGPTSRAPEQFQTTTSPPAAKPVIPPVNVSAVPGPPRGETKPSGIAATPALFADIAPVTAPAPASDETFEDIWAEIGNCTRCPLYQGRTTIVHTDGNQRARLMFVGEAPGADEDAQGRPFVGRAGQLLTKIIEAIGLKREEVLIGNVNRCRPPGNRPPTAEEAAMCKPFLLREIAAARPEVIVVLGNTAVKNLLNTNVGITRLRGEFQDYQGAKVMPTFHPAYLLRDPSKKRETWADLQKVRDYLDSTRKRNT